MCSKPAEYSLSPERGVMAHFLHQGTEAPREGHCPGWLWVAGGGMRGQRGEGAAAQLQPTRAQTAASSCSHQPHRHNGNSPSQPRRATETQPNWIQYPREPVLHRKFPGASFHGLLGSWGWGGVQQLELRALGCMEWGRGVVGGNL